VELPDGSLVAKENENPPHTAVTDAVEHFLEAVTPDGWYVRSQDPITLERSEPEPDVAVVRGDRNRHFRKYPSAADVSVVVEVSDTTLRKDRGFRLSINAEAGIPIYWIVNLADERVEVDCEPARAAAQWHFVRRCDYVFTESVPVAIAGEEVG
jgi:Uma2 family endonuclease